MTFGKRHLVVAALLGLVLGLLVPRLVARAGRQDRSARRLERLSRRLELSPDQRERVAAAFEKSRKRIDAARLETRGEIRAVLDEKQRDKFDKMMERHGRGEGRWRR